MCKDKKLVSLLLIVGLMAFLLVGCSGLNKKEVLNDGTLKITLVPQATSGVTPQTVSDKITLNKFVVTVTKGTSVVTKEAAYSGDTQDVIFDNLAPGTWDIQVTAKDTEGYNCYGGTATANVVGNLTTVEVPLYLLNGNLDLTVKIPVDEIPGLVVDSGTVKLVNPRTGESHVLKDLVINGADGLANFGPVKAGTWYMEADLYSGGNHLAWGSGSLTVLPGRDNHALIEFAGQIEGGDLQITMTIHRSPSDPTGLHATFQSSAVVLNWAANPESNIAGYVVYKATSTTGFKKILTYSLINATTYTDTDVEVGNTYYYWVQAYDINGYSSEFSVPCTITTAETVFPQVDLTQYSSVIYVDGINGSDAGDGSSNQPYQTIDKAYQSLSVDNTAIYIVQSGLYAIPNGLQSLLKTNLRVDYVVRPDLFGQVRFDLKRTNYNMYINMTKYNNFIGIVFQRSYYASENRVYEYFFDSSVIKINIYNCVFDRGEINPGYPMFMSNSNGANKDLYFYNCTFVPQFTANDNSTLPYYGNYINCAFTKSDFTVDPYNLCGVTLNVDYSVATTGWEHAGTGVNPDNTQANIGVYGGPHAWGQW